MAGMGGFSLGARNLSGGKIVVDRNVTLRKLMTNTVGKSLDEIKKYH